MILGMIQGQGMSPLLVVFMSRLINIIRHQEVNTRPLEVSLSMLSPLEVSLSILSLLVAGPIVAIVDRRY